VVVQPPTVAAAAPAPRLKITRVVGGLRIPWDVTWVGGVLLFDQRAGGVWSRRGTAVPRRVAMALPRIHAYGEAGMLGMVADPAASRNRLFYTCMAVGRSGGRPVSVQVWQWRLSPDAARAAKIRTVISGIPLNPSGRHSGCRLRFRSARMLYIGTGDAAQRTTAQNLHSLGGKILRVRSDGTIPTTNPFYRQGGNARYVWNYGHRNVQGLVFRPGSGQLWSVEHGTYRDDEVNQGWKGANYGWRPGPGPGYNESPQMTDLHRYPHAISAKWRSGKPTVATSGATFISGARFGSWNGALAVARLKGHGMSIFNLRGDRIVGERVVFLSYRRVRTVQQGPDGAIYFTTANGPGDGIYRITPA
jgi:glucose/arabinose dehydrogenase